MSQHFKYADGDIGPAKWFENGEDNISPQVLARKSNESKTAWCNRLWTFYGIRPVKYEQVSYDPYTQGMGQKVETVDAEGFLVVSYPNPVDKTPCWNKDTREVMYVSDSQAVPDTYTFEEPTGDPAEKWVEGTGWVINFETAVNLKIVEISKGAEILMESLATEYGAMERSTWDQQYSEAIAYQADMNADIPLLDAIAVSRGMDVATLVGRIVNNRAAWVELSGSIVGQRLAYQDSVDAAVVLHDSNPVQALTDIQSIVVNYRLPTVNLEDK